MSSSASAASSVGLPGKIATFVDKNGDTLQNMALLAYLKKGDEAKPFLETVTTAKVAVDLYRRVTEPDPELENARAEVIANVANYVKAHPRARPHEIQQYVEGQIAVFKTKIK